MKKEKKNGEKEEKEKEKTNENKRNTKSYKMDDDYDCSLSSRMMRIKEE